MKFGADWEMEAYYWVNNHNWKILRRCYYHLIKKQEIYMSKLRLYRGWVLYNMT